MTIRRDPPDLLWWGGTPPYDYEPDPVAVAAAGSLTELADLYGTDKGTLRGNNYTPLYERLLQLREVTAICEIGVACGASLKMWSRYLPHAQVTGIDVREDCARVCRDYSNVTVVTGDVVRMAFPDTFDLIIDDASHVAEDVVELFEHCWSWLRRGGVYAVEDLSCTYLEGYSDDVAARYGIHRSNDRSAVLRMMDRIMRETDVEGEVDHIEYHPNLLLVHKRGS